MSQIQNIEIINFKSIRHQKIEGCRRVNLFIGYPNVGKSNILEAISFFSGGIGANNSVRLSDVVRLKFMNELFYEDNISQDILLKIDSYSCSISFDTREDIDIIYKVDNSGSTFAANPFRMKKDGIFPFVDDPDIFSFHKVRRYDFKKNVTFSQNKVSELRSPFGENLLDIINLNSSLKEFIIEEFKNYNLKVLVDSIDNTLSFIKEKSGGLYSKIYYHQIADTLQRLIFFKAAILSNKESILLFEEPEAHMFPPYISKLTSDIAYGDESNQYFITTHSPFVINDFMERLKKEDLRIYVVGYKKESGETVISHLDEKDIHDIYQYGIDIYMNMENYLPHEQ